MTRPAGSLSHSSKKAQQAFSTALLPVQARLGFGLRGPPISLNALINLRTQQDVLIFGNDVNPKLSSHNKIKKKRNEQSGLHHLA